MSDQLELPEHVLTDKLDDLDDNESSTEKTETCTEKTEDLQEENDEPPMSKRKRKRLERQEKKKMYLKDKRQKERLRKKERMKQRRAEGDEMGPSRKALKHNTMAKSKCKVRVVLDCSFDELMTEKDIKSIVKQVNFCYASNRRADDPVQFHITDFQGRIKTVMDGIGDYHRWDINVSPKSFMESFDKDDIVYLSSDSKNILHTLDDDKVYVIGGLVDHNHHKGLCHQLAEQRGLAHAQLPISDYVSLESRTTLAINHVFEILLRFTESKDWRDAFYKVIPKRKVTQANDSVELDDLTSETSNLGQEATADSAQTAICGHHSTEPCRENIAPSSAADICSEKQNLTEGHDSCGTGKSDPQNNSAVKDSMSINITDKNS